MNITQHFDEKWWISLTISRLRMFKTTDSLACFEPDTVKRMPRDVNNNSQRSDLYVPRWIALTRSDVVAASSPIKSTIRIKVKINISQMIETIIPNQLFHALYVSFDSLQPNMLPVNLNTSPWTSLRREKSNNRQKNRWPNNFHAAKQSASVNDELVLFRLFFKFLRQLSSVYRN